jgi:transcriptional regulator with XRE-family HTH domain
VKIEHSRSYSLGYYRIAPNPAVKIVAPLLLSFTAGTGGIITPDSMSVLNNCIYTSQLHVEHPSAKCLENIVTKEVELRPPADLVANIRDVFGLSMSDLAALLGVTRPTAYAWLEGQEPKPEAVIWIQRLSKTADETKRMNISRLDKLVHRPLVEGRSLFDVLKADEDPTQIIASVREIAEKEAQTRSKPKGSGKHLRSLDDVLGESSVAIDMQS